MSLNPAPAVLLVPGLGGSGAEHWQTIWADQFANCHKVELGSWDEPQRRTWVDNLNLAIRDVDGPVVLVAHSLGCLAAAWWLQSHGRGPVIAAMLVAPPEVDFFPRDDRLTRFAPTPRDPLPVPSRLIASRNDPWIGFHTAEALARSWGSTLVDAGAVGHINAEAELGLWGFGREQLALLMRDAAHAMTEPSACPQAPAEHAALAGS